MRSKQKKKSQVRSFERDARIERLLGAGIIKNPDEIPGDAIPAGLEYIQRTRSSLRLDERPPYYRDIEFQFGGIDPVTGYVNTNVNTQQVPLTGNALLTGSVDA
ncbi:MAG: hypothetical protein J0L84_13730, partial [Verrucomicrobia bacterium]|nr:hypothetical protein [Verrucomicrobiota bacterium]